MTPNRGARTVVFITASTPRKKETVMSMLDQLVPSELPDGRVGLVSRIHELHAAVAAAVDALSDFGELVRPTDAAFDTVELSAARVVVRERVAMLRTLLAETEKLPNLDTHDKTRLSHVVAVVNSADSTMAALDALFD